MRLNLDPGRRKSEDALARLLSPTVVAAQLVNICDWCVTQLGLARGASEMNPVILWFTASWHVSPPVAVTVAKLLTAVAIAASAVMVRRALPHRPGVITRIGLTAFGLVVLAGGVTVVADVLLLAR